MTKSVRSTGSGSQCRQEFCGTGCGQESRSERGSWPGLLSGRLGGRQRGWAKGGRAGPEKFMRSNYDVTESSEGRGFREPRTRVTPISAWGTRDWGRCHRRSPLGVMCGRRVSPLARGRRPLITSALPPGWVWGRRGPRRRGASPWCGGVAQRPENAGSVLPRPRQVHFSDACFLFIEDPEIYLSVLAEPLFKSSLRLSLENKYLPSWRAGVKRD